jgi:hypothetical protein
VPSQKRRTLDFPAHIRKRLQVHPRLLFISHIERGTHHRDKRIEDKQTRLDASEQLAELVQVFR